MAHAKFDIEETDPRVPTWDGKDGRGAGVASGVYLYRLVAGSETQQRSMLLVK